MIINGNVCKYKNEKEINKCVITINKNGKYIIKYSFSNKLII